jgi:predicted transposase YbfD/YdcC
MNLLEVLVRPVRSLEEPRFEKLMQAHHYLGALPKISETLWYVATFDDQWVALLSFSAAALKCSPRDRWIGWDFRHQFGRLKLLTNNSRFLILPGWHFPNLASRILSLCQKRLPADWQAFFGHPVVLIETFVDPQRFRATIYKAANWIYVGNTKGFHRTRQGYSATAHSPKMVFVKALKPNAQALLSRPILEPDYRTGGPKIMLSAHQMKSLPDFFKEIPDPRRAQGRRHRLCTVLAIAAGATLCGMRGYQAISDWANSLGQDARRRFGCRYKKKRYIVPSLSIIRDVLIRVDPVHLDRALQRWNLAYAQQDEALAIDGKTMCNAIDDQGYQTHIMSAVGHQSKTCYTQKKVGTLPVSDQETKRTNEIKTAIPLLEAIDIQGKDITADALLTQRKIADNVVLERNAHYHFTVKNNQPGLFQDIALYFEDRQAPDFVLYDPPDHGRIEIRKIWTTTELNDYLNFPHVRQAFLIQREFTEKKTGKFSCEIAYGITSRPPEQADPQRVLATNRGHWSIENSCHYIIDWNYDEDRSRISKGHGPENITRLRRFAISIIKSKGVRSVAQKMRQLMRNVRLVFDYLRMTENSGAQPLMN